MAYLLLGIAIVCEVIGTTALKLSDGFTRLVPSSMTVAFYAASFYLLAVVLKSLNIGFAYAVWASVGMVLVAIIGVVYFGEKADLPGLLGIALIVTGVIVLNGFSKMSG